MSPKGMKATTAPPSSLLLALEHWLPTLLPLKIYLRGSSPFLERRQLMVLIFELLFLGPLLVALTILFTATDPTAVQTLPQVGTQNMTG